MSLATIRHRRLRPRYLTLFALSWIAGVAVSCSSDESSGPAPSITLSATPANRTIHNGASGQIAISIGRTNFSGNVTLSVESPPAGITATLSPAVASGSSATLDVVVGSTVPTAQYTLTILATATGLPSRSTAVTIQVEPQPDFTLRVSPTSRAIDNGATGQLTVDLTRTNFTGPVTLSLENVPTGMSATVTPSVTTGNSATLAVSVGTTVTPGTTYQLTVVASAPGLPTRTATANIHLNAPNFQLQVMPNDITVVAGGASHQVAVHISERRNLTQPISLTASGMTDITVSFNPASSATADSSVVTVTVAANVPPTIYPIYITGTSTNTTRQTLLWVRVPASFASAAPFR